LVLVVVAESVGLVAGAILPALELIAAAAVISLTDAPALIRNGGRSSR
jgi:hypothetical protein